MRQVTDLVVICWFGFSSQVLWFIAGLECSLVVKRENYKEFLEVMYLLEHRILGGN